MGMGKSWARGNVLGSVTKITLPNTAKRISENFGVQSIMQTTVNVIRALPKEQTRGATKNVKKGAILRVNDKRTKG